MHLVDRIQKKYLYLFILSNLIICIQNLERLLMQRSYVSQLIHEGLWNPDHDYGLNLSSWIGTEQDTVFRDDEFRGLLDMHILDEDSDVNGADRGDHAHSRSYGYRRRHGVDNDAVDVVVVVDDDNNKEGGDGSSGLAEYRGRYERSRGRRAANPELTVGLKRMHLPGSNGRAHRRTTGSSTAGSTHSRRGRVIHSTNTQAENVPANCTLDSPPAANRIIYPSLLSYSPTDTQVAMATRSSDETARGLRTFLQRNPNVVPTINTNPDAETTMTIPEALRPVDTRVSRRRSVVATHSIVDTRPTGSRSAAVAVSSVHAHTRSHPGHPVIFPEAADSNRCNQDSQPSTSGSRSCKVATSQAAGSTNPPAVSSAPGVNAGPARHRRLKGSSILAAFGALASFSTSTSGGTGSGGDSRGANPTGSRSTSKSLRSSAGISQSSSVRRSFTMHHHSPQSFQSSSNSSAQSSSSSSASSVSPHPSPVSPLGRFDGQWAATSTVGHLRQSSKHHRRPCTIQFYVGGHQLPATMPLFEAVRRYSTEFAARLSTAISNADRFSCKSRLPTQLASKLTDGEVEDLVSRDFLLLSVRMFFQTNSSGSTILIDAHGRDVSSKLEFT